MKTPYRESFKCSGWGNSLVYLANVAGQFFEQLPARAFLQNLAGRIKRCSAVQVGVLVKMKLDLRERDSLEMIQKKLRLAHEQFAGTLCPVFLIMVVDNALFARIARVYGDNSGLGSGHEPHGNKIHPVWQNRCDRKEFQRR
ncbi:MAG: hypothetical protein V1844_27255 [Pseudomonadota bacterium]